MGVVAPVREYPITNVTPPIATEMPRASKKRPATRAMNTPATTALITPTMPAMVEESLPPPAAGAVLAHRCLWRVVWNRCREIVGEPGAEVQVETAKAVAGRRQQAVLDRGLRDAIEGDHTDEEHRRRQHEREGVERRPRVW
jgi:hypothetical protein